MNKAHNVPLWYTLERYLILNKLTRPLLRQYHRIKKKYYQLIELRQNKKQPNILRNFEKHIFSQNGEDGILQEIFNRIGTKDKFFVEFGVQDGTQCCTRNLLENAGWSGLWIDCSKTHTDNAQKVFGNFPIQIVNQFLTAENIGFVFKDAKVPSEFDLMVIDVDGNDYWMWKSLAGVYRPRVIVTEYNATFGPKEEWIMPYDPEYRYDETAYFGASLKAFTNLATLHGYRLIGCESRGINAFFVREDVGAEIFDMNKSVAYHFVAPHYDGWYGHPVERVD